MQTDTSVCSDASKHLIATWVDHGGSGGESHLDDNWSSVWRRWERDLSVLLCGITHLASNYVHRWPGRSKFMCLNVLMYQTKLCFQRIRDWAFNNVKIWSHSAIVGFTALRVPHIYLWKYYNIKWVRSESIINYLRLNYPNRVSFLLVEVRHFLTIFCCHHERHKSSAITG